MIEATIGIALRTLGFDSGWVADEINGITLWENNEPQPTQAELTAAGWIKAAPETPQK